ncbi:MAG: polysaccharide deacetylase family protein [Alphaproteobacteria bacterium]|nr:polysaccharide deacetylase family protein [Alphaproteobacteria bacterium]MDE2492843.1 polysaccharide deacetylase family protein [Alphaproteobacteria bacterium]
MGFMRLSIFSLIVAAGMCSATNAADRATADDVQIAWFQSHTIFQSGLRGTHTIALTFDDGPNAYTGAVLDALKASNVKATFFIVGKMAKAHPEMLARIAAEGHLLANHSATHPELTSKFDDDPNLLIQQLREVNDEIAPLMKPSDTPFFRAPYGYWRSAHAAILNADPILRNYTGPIYWDVGGDMILRDGYVMSSADWSCWKHKLSAHVCAKGYLREIRRDNGGVVLMHCIHKESGDLVAEVVPPLIQEGYKFIRLDQDPEYQQYETPKTTPAVASADRMRSAPIVLAQSLK